MKFPFAMLLDFVATDLSAVEVGELLTMAVFELEELEQVEDELFRFKSGFSPQRQGKEALKFL